MPQVRRRAREADEWRARHTGLPQLVADEDRGAIFRGAQGVLDLSLYPISYGGGEFAELNIGLMPGLVSSYKQGAAWKASPIGQKFSAFLAEKSVIILSWIWQAG